MSDPEAAFVPDEVADVTQRLRVPISLGMTEPDKAGFSGIKAGMPIVLTKKCRPRKKRAGGLRL